MAPADTDLVIERATTVRDCDVVFWMRHECTEGRFSILSNLEGRYCYWAAGRDRPVRGFAVADETVGIPASIRTVQPTERQV